MHVLRAAVWQNVHRREPAVMQIAPLDVIRLREGRWRVLGVRAYEHGEVLTLVGLSAHNLALERRFVTPFDRPAPVLRRVASRRVTSRRWRRVCRALIAAETPPGSLACARVARIDLLAHQLEPALALVRGLGSRVLLADEVGLGKTIQAGLIVSELRALGAAERVLVVAPAGLRDQWASELSNRFGLDAAVVDARAMRRLSSGLPLGVNPWRTLPLAIVSVDYLKRPEVVAAAAACPWDVVVVDEAHGVAGDNDRRGAVGAIAARALYVALLTATPHNGDRRAFESLCGIGSTSAEKLLVFRRSRRDVRSANVRRVHRLHIRLSPGERRMHQRLAAFSRAVRIQNRGRETTDYWIALSVLHKRALSSASALLQSVERRLVATRDCSGEARQLSLPIEDPEGELTNADDVPAWSAVLALQDAARERELLMAVAKAAADAARHEAKIAAIARLLRRIDEPAIVFTEFRDTLLHLQRSLARPAVVLHGAMTRSERRSAVESFNGGGARLLLATDAAAEGLNLQRSCRLVINLELPWNPVRLEQRIGRVDRIGQTRRVHGFHLIGRGTGESEILERLRSKVATARADIDAADPLENDAAVMQLLLGERAAESMPATVHTSHDLLSRPSLQREAQAEAIRLAAGRAAVRPGDDGAQIGVEDSAPLIARARRWQTRSNLRGRTLLVWQGAATDGTSQPIQSTIVAVLANRWRERGDTDLRHRVELAAEPWRRAVLDYRRRFDATRRERQLAISGDQSSPVSPLVALFQPGLFDGRAERIRLATLAAQKELAREEHERLRAIERSSAIEFQAPRLLLVLEP